MSDIIQLLPDAVANQIAAGEVVQRPAAAVKELLENAIDAGADKIQLIIKDAGKALIQVIDNGCGMSFTDARMCFERHATSKIRKADDLFAIRTMGFRGEAMASIAAIAQVELKTRRTEDELGTEICVEGSAVTSQEHCAAPAGTSISIKNLFYNTPGRRNFLKGSSIETRHIIDEFQRIALANPQLTFTLHHDGQEVFRLPAATLKQRIVHLFGNNYNQKLVPVQEDTSIIQLEGFIGKPEFARKTRGEQFFFVNNRFIRDNYLNHAVTSAYEEMLQPDSFAFYVLNIQIDPAKIDINVHPTKTEIKYQDEKAIYAIIRSAVKRSLGQYNITPSLDFDRETGFDQMISAKPLDEIVPPSISFNPNFNPFSTDVKTASDTSVLRQTAERRRPDFVQNWDTLYAITQNKIAEQQEIDTQQREIAVDNKQVRKGSERQLFQIHNRFILSQIKSGFMLIDQQLAHERILYERFLQQLENHSGVSQQTLFPQSVSLNAADFELLRGLFADVRALGFDIREFGKNTVIVEGVPAELSTNGENGMLEKLLEGYKNNQSELKISRHDNLARTLARNAAVNAGTRFSPDEMNQLIDQLFACKMPNVSLAGKAIIITYTLEELFQKFDR